MNPVLKVGERVRCVLMKDDELSVPPGTWGKVQKVTQIGDTTHYQIEWENGSSLALLSDVVAGLESASAKPGLPKET